MKHTTKYLKGDALKCYINDSLTYANYVEIAEFLKKKIINVNIPRFADFSAFKLYNFCELENYLHKKADIGMELRLCETIILQVLTEWLHRVPKYFNC